jgi:hypothetical protein
MKLVYSDRKNTEDHEPRITIALSWFWRKSAFSELHAKKINGSNKHETCIFGQEKYSRSRI